MRQTPCIVLMGINYNIELIIEFREGLMHTVFYSLNESSVSNKNCSSCFVIYFDFNQNYLHKIFKFVITSKEYLAFCLNNCIYVILLYTLRTRRIISCDFFSFNELLFFNSVTRSRTNKIKIDFKHCGI